MKPPEVDYGRVRGAWQGRISGCQLGKAVEVLSMLQGREALTEYLQNSGALPLRDYVPLVEGTLVAQTGSWSCREKLWRSEPDDDINYTVLALLMLESKGLDLSTADVARSWIRLLPGGMTFTAERAAYRTLLNRVDNFFAFGGEPGFDLAECADNPWSDWIGAQIRADLYGWVCPGRPRLAADLARRDAALSHEGEGVYGAAFVAALGAAIPASDSLGDALDVACAQIPVHSAATEAVSFARTLVGDPDAVDRLHDRYRDLSPVHTVNNLAVVVWSLLSGAEDFSVAIGEAVAAGWDTDCNGATVGGLWGLSGKYIPPHWTQPWRGRVAVTLAGCGELDVDDLATRTVAVAQRIAQADPA